MMEYQFFRIQEKHLGDLKILHDIIFGNDTTDSFLPNKFNTSEFGASPIGFIAYDENNHPVAFYGVYPCKIEFREKSFLVAQSGDTMTHPEHQGKGLFTQLAKLTYEACKSEDIHLVFGFPNENSYPGFVKRLGWTHFDDLNVYLIRVKGIAWLRLKKTFRLPQSWHSRWCQFILKRQPKGHAFASSIKNDEHAVVDHSPEFFDYKCYGGNFLIQVTGISVWVKFNAEYLIIGDMDVHAEEDFLKVISKLKPIARWCGLPYLRMHVSSSTQYDDWFQRHGKKHNLSYPVGGIAFTEEIPLEMLKFTTADNDTF
jgi:GNAT superfamily N-acetyltransferase